MINYEQKYEKYHLKTIKMEEILTGGTKDVKSNEDDKYMKGRKLYPTLSKELFCIKLETSDKETLNKGLRVYLTEDEGKKLINGLNKVLYGIYSKSKKEGRKIKLPVVYGIKNNQLVNMTQIDTTPINATPMINMIPIKCKLKIVKTIYGWFGYDTNEISFVDAEIQWVINITSKYIGVKGYELFNGFTVKLAVNYGGVKSNLVSVSLEEIGIGGATETDNADINIFSDIIKAGEKKTKAYTLPPTKKKEDVYIIFAEPTEEQKLAKLIKKQKQVKLV